MITGRSSVFEMNPVLKQKIEKLLADSHQNPHFKELEQRKQARGKLNPECPNVRRLNQRLAELRAKRS
ncbi:MAG: hypothetical protein AAF528_00105 [Cyanobacteria bacterium P01_C01_bin.121]